MMRDPLQYPGRRAAQGAAPGARQRGMVQNAAIAGALSPSAAGSDLEKSQGSDGIPVLGTNPNVSRPQRVTDTPPTPLGAPTPGVGWQPHQAQLPPVPGGDTGMPPSAIGSLPSASGRGAANFASLGGGFGNADTQSMKHTFGRIAQHYGTTPQGLQALMNDQEFKTAFPNAKLLGKDKIDFGGQLSDFTRGVPVGIVDVGQAFDDQAGTGQSWQWLDEANSPQAAPSGAAGGFDLAAQQGLGNRSYSTQLLQYLMAQLGQQAPRRPGV